MNIYLFNCIVDGELMPLKLQHEKGDQINELLIRVVHKEPQTSNELTKELRLLLSAFPGFDKAFLPSLSKQNRQLQQLPFHSHLPLCNNAHSIFYRVLITHKALQLYNHFINKAKKYKRKGCRLAEELLLKLRSLARRVSDEIRKARYWEYNASTELHYVVLTQLKLQLVDLYLSIQELYKEQLNHPIDRQYFYLLVLNESPLYIPDCTGSKAATTNKDASTNCGEPKMSFDYRGIKEKLKEVLYQLCNKIELLDETVCKRTDLFNVFISKGFTPGFIKFKLACNTNVFRYIIKRLQNWFDSLSLINVERSALFISKSGNEITSNSLSSSGSRTTKRPKQAALIDTILQGLN